MTEIFLGKLSLDELKKLQKNVAKAIDDFQERHRHDALLALEAKAKEMGFKLSDLTDGLIKKTKTTLPPKYRHPEDPTLTWTGRGRNPDWLKKAEAAGSPREMFLVD